MSEPTSCSDCKVSPLEADVPDGCDLPEVAYAENLSDSLPTVDHKYAEYLRSGTSQVADEALPQTAVLRGSTAGLERYHDDDKEVLVEEPTISRWKRRPWIIFGAALVAVLILAAVLGGVLGSRSKSSGSLNKIGNTTLLKGHTIPYNASIAAAIWVDSQSVLHTALFIQNTSNYILHLDWSSATNAWTLRDDLAAFQSTGTVPTPKSGTPLAATGIQSNGYQSFWNSSVEYPASFHRNLRQFFASLIILINFNRA
jgi:hypothetical protein